MPLASAIGVGMTPFGPHNKPLTDLFADAALDALSDAGIPNTNIDALYIGNAMGGLTENETHLAPKLASHIGLSGIPCQRFEDACATSSNALKHAVQALEADTHDMVLVGGVERCTQKTGLDTAEMTRVFASASHRLYEQPMGLTFPAVFALLVKRYMHEYDLSERQLAEVAVKNHYHGTLNPRAHHGKEITPEEVLDSPYVADPFHLLDCCPFSDGASAVVLTHPEEAESFDGEPIDITGIGHSTGAVPIADKESLTTTPAAHEAAKSAYKQAEISPSDVDVAEVHDCFTGAEIMAIEALGLATPEEACRAAADGRTYIDGDIPVNPSGGLKAKGHPIGATGTAQIVELVEQLRGEADDRQVANATRGVAHNLGGDIASAIVTTMEAKA